MTLFDLLAVAIARYYLYHMPTPAPSMGDPWSWFHYDDALRIFRHYLDLDSQEEFERMLDQELEGL